MKHEKFKELLPLYLDDSLTKKEKELIENHLQNCEECQKELKKYLENHNLLSSLKQEKAPAYFTKSVLDKIAKNKLKNNIRDKQLNKNDNSNSILMKIKNFFTTPVRVPAGIIGITAIILLIFITGLPYSFLNNNNSLNNDLPLRDNSINYQSQNLEQISQYAPDKQSTTDLKTGELSPSVDERLIDSSQTESEESEQKIIKTANLAFELNDIEEINNKIAILVENYNGYIANSRNWLNQNQQIFYWFEVKVPAKNFNKILEELSDSKYGQLISRSISSQDVTDEYMDLNIRLKNLSAQEERYRQLLNKAIEVEEILKIENELNRIRTDIERLQGWQKRLNQQINYSTITIEFHQPEPISSGTPDIIKTIRNAINKMIDQFYQIIIYISTILPYLLLLLIGYLIYKKYRKN
jgi:hypothetical protein